MKTNRLAALAHYVIWRCDPADLGAVKLYKILWFADLEHYRRTGHTITGAAAYTKLQFGPVPKGIQRALEALEREEKIATAKENYYGRPKTMFLARSRPDLAPFGADEIAIVDMVADAICRKHTAASISDLTHDALWSETEIGTDMPIGAAAVISGDVTADDLDWAEKALAD
jgi:Antitoxin SocA-like, Panacea domain